MSNTSTEFSCDGNRTCYSRTTNRWCASGKLEETRVVKSDTVVRGSIVRTEQLPSNAFVDPDPDPSAWSCTAASLGRPVEWRLQTPGTKPQGFFSTEWLDMSDISRPKSILHLELHNSALVGRPGGGVVQNVGGWTPALTPYLPVWQPALVYDFSLSPGEDMIPGRRRPYPNMVGWSVRFDAEQGYLELNHTWYCNDKNPSKP